MGDEIAIAPGMKHHRVRNVRSAPTGSNRISRIAQRHFPVRTGGLITFLSYLQHSIFPVDPLVRKQVGRPCRVNKSPDFTSRQTPPNPSPASTPDPPPLL